MPSNKYRPYKSRQEQLVAKCYPNLRYEPSKIPYVRRLTYTPDFELADNVYLECKEYIAYQDVAKYEAIASCNPHIIIKFLVKSASPKTLARLRRTFDVTVSDFTIPFSWQKEIPNLRTDSTEPKEQLGKN